MQKIIAVDLDDCLAQSIESLYTLRTRQGYTLPPIDQQRTWQLEEVWGCPLDEIKRFIDEWYGSVEHAEALPVSGAKDGIQVLMSEGYTLHIVTGRAPLARPFTEQWIEKNFPHTFADIHFTDHLKEPPEVTKGSVCRKLGAQFLIEDMAHHAEDVAKQGIPVLLFDQPWNRTMPEHRYITRVRTWGNIVWQIQHLTR